MRTAWRSAPITVGVDQTNPTLDLTGSEPFQYVVVEPAGSSEDGFYIQSISGQVTDYSSTDGAIVVAEDTSITIDVLNNDTDADLPNDHLSITGLGDPEHGTVSVVNGQVLYTPDADYNGPDSFTYTITDNFGASDTATVYLNVSPVARQHPARGRGRHRFRFGLHLRRRRRHRHCGRLRRVPPGGPGVSTPSPASGCEATLKRLGQQQRFPLRRGIRLGRQG